LFAALAETSARHGPSFSRSRGRFGCWCGNRSHRSSPPVIRLPQDSEVCPAV